ncbi:hypothetical protein SAMN05444342_3226 [Haladaptatus paucihalophilus DX253]|uniref:Uncharacterized protein n=1 Tax=Haladaptatus paucihalophilus DX253 TaxID=797209 RepID=A0A1M6YNX8_HALPU|nr:hypothetical protein SAMN05444342_3226 [Haladaptatus paucihalophilus DX253]
MNYLLSDSTTNERDTGDTTQSLSVEVFTHLTMFSPILLLTILKIRNFDAGMG